MGGANSQLLWLDYTAGWGMLMCVRMGLVRKTSNDGLTEGKLLRVDVAGYGEKEIAHANLVVVQQKYRVMARVHETNTTISKVKGHQLRLFHHQRQEPG